MGPWQYLSGYEKLSGTVTVNSVSVTPTYRFHGKDATAGGWNPQVGSVAMAEANSGVTTDPTYSFSGTWGNGIDYNGGKYHQAASDAYGIGTQDYYKEIIAVAVSANEGIAGKYHTGTPAGCYTSWNTSGRIYHYIRNGATSVTVQSAASALTAGTLYFISIFCDRNENSTSGCRIYANGSLVASGNPSTLSAANLDSSVSRLRIGTNAEAPTNECTGAIYYVAKWLSSGWFAGGATNDTEWLAYHQARYAVLTG